MKQTDILRHAKDYLDKLNRGADPLSDTPLPADSVGREPKVHELFYRCSVALKRIIIYDENSPESSFFITPQQRSTLTPTEPSITLMPLMSQINKAVALNICRELAWSTLCDWLVEQGMLVKEARYSVTPQGRALGIEPTGGKRFSPSAQQFIFDHLEDISQWHRAKGKTRNLRKAQVEKRDVLEYNQRGMELLSQGRHPITGEPMAAGEALTRERLRKCFAWVALALTRSLERGFFTAKISFSLPKERWADIPVKQEPVTLRDFVSSVNALLPDPTAADALAPLHVQEFLLSQGLMEEGRSKTGRKTHLLTPAGEEMGITPEERVALNGKHYTTLLYAPQIQQYLIDHMGEIIAVAAQCG